MNIMIFLLLCTFAVSNTVWISISRVSKLLILLEAIELLLAVGVIVFLTVKARNANIQFAGLKSDLRDYLSHHHGLVVKVVKRKQKFVITVSGGPLLLNLGYYHSEFTGKTIDELHRIPDDVKTYLIAQFEQAWSGTVVTDEFLIQDRNIVLSIHPNYKASDVSSLICVGLDITDRKRVDQENHAINQFISHISHEIRTPISGMVGLSNLLKETELSPLQADYASKILLSSYSVLGMLNDVLDLSSIRSGKFKRLDNIFYLQDIFENIARVLSGILHNKNLTFIIDDSRPLPALLYGDSLRLEQILLNVLTNALKFTPTGYIFVRVEEINREHGRSQIQFTIEDTGIGISQDRIHEIFRPFTQADDDISRQFGGNGLGLSICKYLISFMNGTMKLESALGLGSKLTIQLPFELSYGPLPIDQCTVSSLNDPIPTVLVIERDAVIRQGLCSLLASICMHVEWCDDFEEEQIHFEGADFIVMNLDVLEGAFEKWVQWRDQVARTGIKIIGIVSIHERDEFAKYPAYIQPDAYLVQPVTQKGLSRVLESLNKRDEANVSLTLTPNMRMNQQPCWISCLHDRKVLIVEDQEINQLVISEMIRARCGQVTVASDGFDALRKLDAEHWDIILMDIHLPKLDGLETTRIIRREARYRELPIIAVTANMDVQHHEAYYQAGMNDVILKPLDERKIDEIMAKWLNKQQVTHEPLAPMTDMEVPRVRGIDVPSLLEQVGGKEYIVIRIFENFYNEYSDFSERLTQALNQGNTAEAYKMVHTLRGVASHISAYALFNHASCLEEALDQNEPYHPYVLEIQQSLQEIIVSLQDVITTNAITRERMVE